MNKLFKIVFLAALVPFAACKEQTAAQLDTVPVASEEELSQKTNEVVIKAGDLGGLYIEAEQNAPIVLIIPGSGPTDLNGNSPLGIKANSYALLAEGLAKRGVSTVRVDKRGLFSSADAGDPNAVTVDIYAKDYSLWADRITAQTGAECIYLLGHSEGALMASAAANLNAKVCGQILVAGVGRSFGEVLREQLKANPANIIIMKEALATIEKLEAGERVKTEDMNFALKPLFRAEVQDHMISLMQADPSKIAADANVKTLIIQGETDLQTSVEDAKTLAEATNGTLVIVPGVNHVLKEAPKSRRKNLKTYRQADLPISAEVVDAVAEFVRP